MLAGIGFVLGGTADPAATIHMVFDQFLPGHQAVRDPFGRVEQALTEVVASRTQLSLAGLPLFVWFSGRLFGSVRAALNEVFDTEESRAYPLAKLLDVGLGAACAVLIAVNTLVTAFFFAGSYGGRFLATLSAWASAALLFFLVYTVAPSRRVRWDTALVAAMFTSLAFEVGKKLYGFYLSEFATIDRFFTNANAIAALLFVFYVYYTAWVFLAGGEVAETYDLARRQREQREALI
jgi:membrane protein